MKELQTNFSADMPNILNVNMYVKRLLRVVVVDYCEGVHCSSHGRCINERTGYQCNCDEGFTGQNCESSKYKVLVLMINKFI